MGDFINTTTDSLFCGDLVCHQSRNGYRFSIDSVLLAHFSLSWKKAKILDMGCGCGILGLILLYRRGSEILSIEGIELQQGLAEAARKNCAANNFSSKLNVTVGDFREISNFFPCGYFSHIICNPPFYRIGSGRTSSSDEAFLARHQAAACIPDVVAAASYALKNKGIFSLVYPAESAAELLHHLVLKKLEPKRLRLVYSYPESEAATLVLVECVKNGGVGMRIMKPLYIYDKCHGKYTEEVNIMYQPNENRRADSSC